MSKKLKPNFASNETRPLDAIPWTAGPTFSSPADKRKLDLAIRRFWDGYQLRYRRGEKVRTKHPRLRPGAVDLFALLEAASRNRAA